jgi:hypothetical protein
VVYSASPPTALAPFQLLIQPSSSKQSRNDLAAVLSLGNSYISNPSAVNGIYYSYMTYVPFFN